MAPLWWQVSSYAYHRYVEYLCNEGHSCRWCSISTRGAIYKYISFAWIFIRLPPQNFLRHDILMVAVYILIVGWFGATDQKGANTCFEKTESIKLKFT